MEQNNILAAIDDEIRRLQEGRAVIADILGVFPKRGPGRPKGSTSAVKRKKRAPLSAGARARIAAVQKKRWAAEKKTKQ